MKSNLRNEIKSYIVRQGMTMQEIKKEQEAANLKIGFINKKKERKAQEEITD